MLQELKFVQGSVSKKDLVPALTHFCIEGGTVRGYNGALAICTPIALDIACKPKAEPLIKAIGHCDETVQLSLTATGRLSVRSGAFRALIDCVEGDTPHVEPEGDHFEINGEDFISALRAVNPFIGNDASRPWSNGVLLAGYSAFATNNIILSEYWIGSAFPKTVNVPRAAIKEILRVGEAPTSMQMAENSMTLHYANGKWIRTQLLTTEWPDMSPILDRESTQTPINEQLFRALEKIKPFVDKYGRAFVGGGQVSTHLDNAEGAVVELADLQAEGVYSLEMLALLEGCATSIDWTAYPRPCLFQGTRLRGAIVGMKI